MKWKPKRQWTQWALDVWRQLPKGCFRYGEPFMKLIFIYRIKWQQRHIWSNLEKTSILVKFLHPSALIRKYWQSEPSPCICHGKDDKSATAPEYQCGSRPGVWADSLKIQSLRDPTLSPLAEDILDNVCNLRMEVNKQAAPYPLFSRTF